MQGINKPVFMAWQHRQLTRNASFALFQVGGSYVCTKPNTIGIYGQQDPFICTKGSRTNHKALLLTFFYYDGSIKLYCDRTSSDITTCIVINYQKLLTFPFYCCTRITFFFDDCFLFPKLYRHFVTL